LVTVSGTSTACAAFDAVVVSVPLPSTQEGDAVGGGEHLSPDGLQVDLGGEQSRG